MPVSENKTKPLQEKVRELYDQFGQRKPMGQSAPNPQTPHFFLHRTFLGENDLLIIFNTKRCRFQCPYCTLPYKSSKNFISGDDVLLQFECVMEEMKHSLSVLDRLTLSNEGSVLDSDTFPTETLLKIARCVRELRLVRTIVLETRTEFIEPDIIRQIQQAVPRATVDILTGFETHRPDLREMVLGKRQSLESFEEGLDRIAECGASLSAYLLFKPSPIMTDDEAFIEAEESIDYLVEKCQQRGIAINCVRINPMYLADGSPWAKIAKATPQYKPPRLTDVMRLAAKKAEEGLRVYIGLSTEGLGEEGGDYMSREDYTPSLIRPVKLFNDRKISSFEGII